MDRFSIDKLIKEANNLDYLDLIKYLNKQLTWVEKAKLSNNEKYEASNFRMLIKEFLYFLQTGQNPAKTNKWNFNKTKIIISNLIDKGQLEKSALDIYQI